MSFHKWRRVATKHFGEVSVPYAHIQVQAAGGRFQSFSLQVDSGATVSLLRRSVAELLGFKLKSGRRVELTSVGGSRTVAYVHTLRTRFAEKIEIEVPFAIADNESVPNLLGRLGVFDVLQVDFDATTRGTEIRAPWLSETERAAFDRLVEIERHILSQWQDMQVSQPAKEASRRLINRAGELLAAMMGMLKLHRVNAAPLLVRSMFEVALQFEYLWTDPDRLGQQYLDYTPVTVYKTVQGIVENPSGMVSRRIAKSPVRATAEPRLRVQYEAVRGRFQTTNQKTKKKKDWQNWYGMTVDHLAGELGWDGEYRLWYKAGSAWAHGDPASAGWPLIETLFQSRMVWAMVLGFYARMILRVADCGEMILTPEQTDLLRILTKKID